MSGEISGHLDRLHVAAGLSLESAAGDASAELGRLLQLDLDLLAWEQALLGRPETQQLTDARRELGFALFGAASGMYMHAYAGLRVFLELSVASVYFSANELLRRRWVADRADFSWSKAFSEDSGVWSRNFVREFHEPGIEDSEHYAKDAADCYRHCSQFLHGKLKVHSQLPDTLMYSKSVLMDWIATATRSAEAVLFLLFLRYGEELLPSGDERLAGSLQDSFGHLQVVRRSLGLPVDEGSRRGI